MALRRAVPLAAEDSQAEGEACRMVHKALNHSEFG